jgi:copper homeostasis protein
MTFLEVACFTPDSALIAAGAGADRIELCDEQAQGGTTPPISWVTTVKSSVQIPVYVMIRPRGGTFVYDIAEHTRMRAAIAALHPLVDGFVLGVLDSQRGVDVAATTELVRLAHPRPVTFHRAFDETADLSAALELVVATGCRAILSSGGARSADEGAEVLGRLVRQAEGRIAIIPGGGVRSGNVHRIRQLTGASFCHSSALVGEQEVPDADEIRALKQVLGE